MPILLSQRPAKAKRKVPPCGRLITHVAPHSPFQKLIAGRQARKGLSIRGLARLISQDIKTNSSTLYAWLHNENGFPHPKAFKELHIVALAKVLDIPELDIKKALDGSRHLYTRRGNPMPVKSKDAFRTFIEILKNDKNAAKKTIRRSYVLNLAINLYRGATGEDI